jgi:hypothetical protein
MNKFEFFTGVIVVIISFYLIRKEYSYVEVYNGGKIVKMKITEIPFCITAKTSYESELQYQGKKYVKRTKLSKYCRSYRKGDYIALRYLKGSEVLLFPEQQFGRMIMIYGLIGCFGVGLAAKGLFKRRTL